MNHSSAMVIEKITDQYRQYFNHRDPDLFLQFLPQGYQYMTLSSVPEELREELTIAKVHLGMLITLFDDFADNPQFFNPTLLNALYQIPLAHHVELATDQLNQSEYDILQLAMAISQGFLQRLTNLQHYSRFKSVLEFDLQQFYNCNRYFELATQQPEILNVYELSQLSAANMGMVVVGMLDMMATPEFGMNELSMAREFFYHGQRFGKICNNLVTISREIKENDFTNELIVLGLREQVVTRDEVTHLTMEAILQRLKPFIIRLQCERKMILAHLKRQSNKINCFDGECYITGLQNLQSLHERFAGVI